MAKRALGTLLKKGTVSVGGLTSIGGVDMSADTIDVTTLTSTGRDFLAGFKDGGEVSIEGFFNPSDSGQADLIADFNSGDSDSYSIEFVSLAYKWTFNAIVTKITTGAAVEDAISFSATLKVSGLPTLTAIA